MYYDTFNSSCLTWVFSSLKLSIFYNSTISQNRNRIGRGRCQLLVRTGIWHEGRELLIGSNVVKKTKYGVKSEHIRFAIYCTTCKLCVLLFCKILLSPSIIIRGVFCCKAKCIYRGMERANEWVRALCFKCFLYFRYLTLSF